MSGRLSLSGMVDEWLQAAEDEVDAGAASAFRHCAEQLGRVVAVLETLAKQIEKQGSTTE